MSSAFGGTPANIKVGNTTVTKKKTASRKRAQGWTPTRRSIKYKRTVVPTLSKMQGYQFWSNTGALVDKKPYVTCISSIKRDTGQRRTAAVRIQYGLIRMNISEAENCNAFVRIIVFQWLGKESMLAKTTKAEYASVEGEGDSALWTKRVIDEVGGDITLALGAQDSGGELNILADERIDISGSYTADDYQSYVGTGKTMNIKVQMPDRSAVINYGTNVDGDEGKGNIGVLMMCHQHNKLKSGDVVTESALPSVTFTSQLVYTEA